MGESHDTADRAEDACLPMIPYFPDEEADTYFVGLVLGQMPGYVVYAGSLHTHMLGYVYSHGTYHFVLDGKDPPPERSKPADYVSDAQEDASYLCPRPTHSARWKKNLWFPKVRRDMAQMWLRLLLFLATLLLVGSVLGYAFWQMHHFM